MPYRCRIEWSSGVKRECETEGTKEQFLQSWFSGGVIPDCVKVIDLPLDDGIEISPEIAALANILADMEIDNAEQVTEATQSDGSSETQPEVREEGGDSAEGGKGVRRGRQSRGKVSKKEE